MIPNITIRQSYAKIGIDSTAGKQEIRQPKAELSIKQVPLQLDINKTPSKLEIDSSKAWSALGKRPSLELTKVIYAETSRIVNETIAKTVKQGKRLAAIHLEENPIPQFAKENAINFQEFNYEYAPSSDNVDIKYTPSSIEINWQGGGINYDVNTNQPQISYQRGNVNIYLTQKNSIEIIPPKIDTII